MHITVVVVLCHTVAHIAAPVCREEIVIEGTDLSMYACMVGAQPAIAAWKDNHQIYRGDQWTIARIKCVPGGGYVIKDRV